MKRFALVIFILSLVCFASAQDIAINKNRVDIQTQAGEMQYRPDGLNGIAVETHINGQKFSVSDSSIQGNSKVKYSSSEKAYFILPDPKVQQEYQIFDNGTIEETIYLKERMPVAWNAKLTGNDYLQSTGDGGYKVVSPGVNEREEGYVYISQPSGWDANGVHISYAFELGKDGRTLSLVEPKKNDNNDNIAYPVVVDPVYIHKYDLVLLLHGNYETDSATPTQDYRDSSRYFHTGAVGTGTANSGNTTKLLGNGSYFIQNGNITLPDSPEYTLGTNNWSLSFSIFEPIAAYKDMRIEQIQDANNYNRFSIPAGAAPVFTAARGGSSLITCSGNTALKAPGWSNISVIINASTCIIYINGTSYGVPAARIGSLTDLNAPVLISSLTSTGTASAFNIDEIKLFNGGFAPTVNEIDGVEYPLFLNATTSGANLGYGDDNSTVSLLHFDGANAGSVFTDQIGNRSWAVSATAITSDDSKKFGPTAGYFNGSGRIAAANAGNFDFGTSDWTIDAWENVTAYTSGTLYSGIFSTQYTGSGGGYAALVTPSGQACIVSNASGSATYDVCTPAGTIQNGTLAHLAYVRNGTALKIYKNGNLAGSSTIPSGYVYSSYGHIPVIAASFSDAPSIWNYQGYIDELRITKGVARWTTNFTPPTTPYEITAPAFTITPPALSGVGSVQFNDTSPDSAWTQNGFYWDFGDNTTSTLQNPLHTYSSVGVYTVTFNTLNNNMTAATSKTLPVGAPIVDFACSPLAGTAALQVICQDLTQNATPITSYLIDFGDGSTSTATPPWNHVYSTFGAFSVNLTETNSIGTDFEYKRDYIVTSTNQNQQQTWYTPKSVLFNVYDSKYNKVVGAFVNITPDVSTFPDGTNWLVDMYGIRPDVANQMLNGTLLMSGTTKSNGAITFTMLSSIGYNIAVTNPANGIIQTTNVTPIDPYYNINLVGSATNNTYVDMGYNTSLYITEPDIRNVTMNLAYQDISARTTLLEFYVLARINNTVINYQSATGFGSNVVLMNYTVPNIRPDQYSWYYNGVRTK